MQKTFCDICGKLVATKTQVNNLRVDVTGSVLCDENAKIEMAVHSCFKNHSTGYGGPPDLCSTCLIDCLYYFITVTKKNLEIEN